ncbi:MAG: hypothetical protein JNK65_04280 [Deltaproteobacteria bacterium]|nr:hypothetical protein [Deltaproteobacteria bacterium]
MVLRQAQDERLMYNVLFTLLFFILFSSQAFPQEKGLKTCAEKANLESLEFQFSFRQSSTDCKKNEKEFEFKKGPDGILYFYPSQKSESQSASMPQDPRFKD